MTAIKDRPTIVFQVLPGLLTKAQAAAWCGMGLTSFEKYVYPDLKLVRRGTLVLVPLPELERWRELNADAL